MGGRNRGVDIDAPAKAALNVRQGFGAPQNAVAPPAMNHPAPVVAPAKAPNVVPVVPPAVVAPDATPEDPAEKAGKEAAEKDRFGLPWKVPALSTMAGEIGTAAYKVGNLQRNLPAKDSGNQTAYTQSLDAKYQGIYTRSESFMTAMSKFNADVTRGRYSKYDAAEKARIFAKNAATLKADAERVGSLPISEATKSPVQEGAAKNIFTNPEEKESSGPVSLANPITHLGYASMDMSRISTSAGSVVGNTQDNISRTIDSSQSQLSSRTSRDQHPLRPAWSKGQWDDVESRYTPIFSVLNNIKGKSIRSQYPDSGERSWQDVEIDRNMEKRDKAISAAKAMSDSAIPSAVPSVSIPSFTSNKPMSRSAMISWSDKVLADSGHIVPEGIPINHDSPYLKTPNYTPYSGIPINYDSPYLQKPKTSSSYGIPKVESLPSITALPSSSIPDVSSDGWVNRFVDAIGNLGQHFKSLAKPSPDTPNPSGGTRDDGTDNTLSNNTNKVATVNPPQKDVLPLPPLVAKWELNQHNRLEIHTEEMVHGVVERLRGELTKACQEGRLEARMALGMLGTSLAMHGAY